MRLRMRLAPIALNLARSVCLAVSLGGSVPAPKIAESVARELIEAFCDANTQRVRSLLADDLRVHHQPGRRRRRGRCGGVSAARGGHGPPERATQAHDHPDVDAEAGYGPR